MPNEPSSRLEQSPESKVGTAVTAALIMAQSVLRRWADLYARLANESGPLMERKMDYVLPPADHVRTLEAIEVAIPLSLVPALAPSEIQRVGWIPVTERLPDVPPGEEQEYWVCAHRKHNGKRYVFTLWYVNKPHLDPKTGETADWALESEYEDKFDAVGWHEIGPSESYDEYYKAVESVEEIIAWMPITKPEAPHG